MLFYRRLMMADTNLDFTISRLGDCRFPSPMSTRQFVGDHEYVLYHDSIEDIKPFLDEGKDPPKFELAGPREKIYFNPSKLKCGIITCGGLCPGLNDVVRAIVLALHHHYGVKYIFGFRYGFEGLSRRHGHTHIELTPSMVDTIHKMGGSFLASSRGAQDVDDMVDTIEQMGIDILFTIGGDGTLKGAEAIAGAVERRGLQTGLIGIPKTIDNDISFIQSSFGFHTAVSESRKAIDAANTEALGAKNGIGLVKLMGRESGFIAAYAALANNEVNYCLIPEVPFALEGFLTSLEERLQQRGHAVIVVGEGAGQNLLRDTGEKDASGNLRFSDIGVFLKDNITGFFKRRGMEVNLKYIDPSYTIRSLPASPHDSAFCLLLGHHAVHAGMSGRTGMVVGNWKTEFTHVPIKAAVSRRKKIDPCGKFWAMVRSCTGQPEEMV